MLTRLKTSALTLIIFFMGATFAGLGIYVFFKQERSFLTSQLLTMEKQYYYFISKWKDAITQEQKLRQENTLALADLNTAKKEYAELYEQHLVSRRTLQTQKEALIAAKSLSQQQEEIIFQLESQVEEYALKIEESKDRLDRVETPEQKEDNRQENEFEAVIAQEDSLSQSLYREVGENDHSPEKALSLNLKVTPTNEPSFFRSEIKSINQNSIVINFGAESGAEVNMKLRLQHGLAFLDYATILKVNPYTSVIQPMNSNHSFIPSQKIIIAPETSIKALVVSQYSFKD